MTTETTKPTVRPEIVVLCGSTRFTDAFRRENLRLTLEGKIVLSVGCDTRSDADLAAAGEFGPGGPTEALKQRLDWLHMRKIDLADRAHILNVGGYVGESTAQELTYARGLGKAVTFLEPVIA